MKLVERVVLHNAIQNQIQSLNPEAVHEKLCWFWQAECPRPGKRMLALDGSSGQLADTPANQLECPRPPTQQPSCGWPVMHAVGLY